MQSNVDEKQSQHQNVSDTLHCTVNMLFSRLNAARGVIKVFVIRVRRLFENLFYSFLYLYFVFVVKDDKQKNCSDESLQRKKEA